MNKRPFHEMTRLEEDIPIHLTYITAKTARENGTHWHSDIEINLICNENVDYYIENTIEKMTPGRICIINSDVVHRIHINQIEKQDDTIIAFTLFIKRNFLKKMTPNFSNFFWQVNKKEDEKAIANFMFELTNLYRQKRNRNTFNYDLLSCVCQIMKYLCENCMFEHLEKNTADETALENEKIFLILDYINRHYQFPLTQESVAQTFYYSRSYFSSFFKKYTGQTFKKYLTEIRISQAEKLLKNENYSISQIAQNVGFNDERRFIETFKKFYDITPGNYRKKFIHKNI